MRECQICHRTGKKTLFNDYDSQPMCLFECTDCGHRYVDALHLTQEWFDDYYLHRYSTDDLNHSVARLDSLAAFVMTLKPKTVLDIGGRDLELQRRLDAAGADCTAVDVGWKASAKFNAVVLSHTLEHVYEVGDLLKRVVDVLSPKGALVIEVPIHEGYTHIDKYDYHFQHINKFRPADLLKLLQDNGFDVIQNRRIEDYREYQCWRIAGRYAVR